MGAAENALKALFEALQASGGTCEKIEVTNTPTGPKVAVRGLKIGTAPGRGLSGPIGSSPPENISTAVDASVRRQAAREFSLEFAKRLAGMIAELVPRMCRQAVKWPIAQLLIAAAKKAVSG